MDVTYVPQARKAGARLHALARVRRVLFERGRAAGVEGETVDPGTNVDLEVEIEWPSEPGEYQLVLDLELHPIEALEVGERTVLVLPES